MGEINNGFTVSNLDEITIEHVVPCADIPASTDSAKQPECGVDFEVAITATGYGKFHYVLLLLCGISFGCFSCETLNVGFLMPAAECDLHLTSQDKGWLSAIVFLGMMFGSYIWGSLGDSLGRKEILVISLFLEFLCSLSSSFVPSFAPFLILKFFAGICLSGTLVVFSFFAEFQPANKRGGMISLLDAFYVEGHVFMTGLAWLVIPLTFSYTAEAFTYNSWRLYTSLCAVRSLISALGLLWLPESPKFLLAKGRHDQALQVLRRIFRLNTGKSEKEYPYTQLFMEIEADKVEKKSIKEKLKKTVNEIGQQSKTLFKPPLLKSILLMVLIQFVLQFANSGLILWLPELFNSLESYMALHPNASVTMCEVISAENNTLTEPSCWPDEQVYINGIIVAVASLLGNVWTFFHMDKLGRKFFIVFGLFTAGVSALLVIFIKSSIGDLVLTSFFVLSGNLSFNAINVLTTELFPTTVRSTAFSVSFLMARLGGILGTVTFGALIDIICELPIGLFAAFLIGGGSVAFLLPNTTGKTLE